MTAEDRPNRKKIQVWISADLWDSIVSIGYTNQTAAVTDGLEALREISQNSNKSSQEIPILQARLEEKEAHIITLQTELDRLNQNYSNYMAQMQTLITKNILEAPPRKKRGWEFWK